MPAEPLRLLQLIEPDASAQAATLADLLGEGFVVTTRVVTRRTLPLARALRRERARYDVVHAWGIGALTAAAFGTRGPVVFKPGGEPSGVELRWLRTVVRYRRVEVACESEGQWESLVARGVPPERCRTILPGVDAGSSSVVRDEEMRRRLGFRNDDRVMLLAGTSTRAAGHAEALWAAAILGVLNPAYRVLVCGGGPRTTALVHFARSQKQPLLLTVASEREFERLLPAADLVLVTPLGVTSPLPIVRTMNAGVPIVGTASPGVREWLEDGRTALLARPGSPRALAQRVLEADAETTRRCAAAARAEVAERFSTARWVAAHRTIFARVGNLAAEAARPGGVTTSSTRNPS